MQSIYEFKDIQQAEEYKFLKEFYCDEELIDVKNNPAIVYYAGKLGKPWRRKFPPKDFEEYTNKIPKSLKKITFRDFRKKLFNKV